MSSAADLTTETGINTTGAALGLGGGPALRRSARAGPRRRTTPAWIAEAATVAPGADGVLVARRSSATASGPTRACGAPSPASPCDHGRASLARAMLEGVAFAIRAQLDLLRGRWRTRHRAARLRRRRPPRDVEPGQGRRLRAPVVRAIPGDAAVTGVAMLAGLGAGIYRDAAEAIARCVRPRSGGRARPVTAVARYDDRATGPIAALVGIGGRAPRGTPDMQLRLGINTCFAVKRWPTTADWAPIVRDRLGLRLVQHSFDLVEPPSTTAARPWPATVADLDLELHSTFTGLAAYSANLLLHPAPDGAARRGTLVQRGDRLDGRGGRRGDRRSRRGLLRRRLERSGRSTRTLVRPSGLARPPGGRGGARPASTTSSRREPGGRARAIDDGDDPRPGHGRRRRPRPDPPVPRRRAHVRAGDERIRARSVCLAVRDGAAGRRSSSSSSPTPTVTTTGRSPRRGTPRAGSRPTASSTRSAPGGVASAALILEVIPAFEQADDEVLDDLAASVDYWRDALDRRGVLAS